MDVKFEEETYEDEDWFLMLLSELIFKKLKLDRPAIELNYVPLIEEEEVIEILADSQELIESITPEHDIKELLSKEGPTD